MELIFAHQIGFEQLNNKKFDYFIAASGYENRCSYLIDTIGVNATHKLVLAFDDKKDFLYRPKNDSIFSNAGFDFIMESAHKKDNLFVLLSDICRVSFGLEKVSILVDYSCMSKVWYAGVLNFFISNELNIGNLEIYFSYTSAEFSEPRMPEAKFLHTTPKGLLKANVRSGKPRALILGLGYEKFLTTRLIESFEYKEVFAFYSDPAFDNRYAERVMKNNRKILKSMFPDHVYKYPIDNMKETDRLLTSLTLKLRLEYHVAILPAGPKPITLSSANTKIRFS